MVYKKPLSLLVFSMGEIQSLIILGEAEEISNFSNNRVWKEDAYIIGDQQMISIDMIWRVNETGGEGRMQVEDEKVRGRNINDK